jgi:apolipoprotein D and lipocalin family protein
MSIEIARISLLVTLLASLSCCQMSDARRPLPKAAYINLTRIFGVWQVPARIPTYLDKKASEMRFVISPGRDQSFHIKWEFKEGSENFPSTKWNLTSKLFKENDTTSWMVSPIWPIKLHYQVIEYSADYSWLVLGSTDRKHLWVLSRKKSLDSALLSTLLERLKISEFDVTRIVGENAKNLD